MNALTGSDIKETASVVRQAASLEIDTANAQTMINTAKVMAPPMVMCIFPPFSSQSQCRTLTTRKPLCYAPPKYHKPNQGDVN